METSKTLIERLKKDFNRLENTELFNDEEKINLLQGLLVKALEDIDVVIPKPKVKEAKHFLKAANVAYVSKELSAEQKAMLLLVLLTVALENDEPVEPSKCIDYSGLLAK
jgi:hypothetical protein